VEKVLKSVNICRVNFRPTVSKSNILVLIREKNLRTGVTVLKVTRRGQRGFDTAAYNQTDPPPGSTEAWEESDIYDCVVIGNESALIQLAQCWFSGLAISNAKI